MERNHHEIEKRTEHLLLLLTDIITLHKSDDPNDNLKAYRKKDDYINSFWDLYDFFHERNLSKEFDTHLRTLRNDTEDFAKKMELSLDLEEVKNLILYINYFRLKLFKKDSYSLKVNDYMLLKSYISKINEITNHIMEQKKTPDKYTRLKMIKCSYSLFMIYGRIRKNIESEKLFSESTLKIMNKYDTLVDSIFPFWIEGDCNTDTQRANIVLQKMTDILYRRFIDDILFFEHQN